MLFYTKLTLRWRDTAWRKALRWQPYSTLWRFFVSYLAYQGKTLSGIIAVEKRGWIFDQIIRGSCLLFIGKYTYWSLLQFSAEPLADVRSPGKRSCSRPVPRIVRILVVLFIQLPFQTSERAADLLLVDFAYGFLPAVRAFDGASRDYTRNTFCGKSFSSNFTVIFTVK